MDEKSRSVVPSTGTDPAQLRAELADTRAQMGDTIEALHGRLNPAVLKDQALDSFHEVKAKVTSELKHEFAEAKEAVKAELTEAKAALKMELSAELAAVKEKVAEELSEAKHAVREATIGKVEHMVQSAQDTVSEAGNSMMHTIKSNPVPMALIGAGLAWLFVNNRRKSSSTVRFDSGSRYDTNGDTQRFDRPSDAFGETVNKSTHRLSAAVGGATHRVGDFASDTGHRIADVSHNAVDAMGRVAHNATDVAGNIAHAAAEKSTQLARATRDGVVSLEQRTSNRYHSNPMAFGAAILAAGTAIGLAIPSTRREDQLIGGVRDQLMGKVGDLAHEALDKMGDAAKEFAQHDMQGMRDNNGKQRNTNSQNTNSQQGTSQSTYGTGSQSTSSKSPSTSTGFPADTTKTGGYASASSSQNDGNGKSKSPSGSSRS